LQKLFWWCFRKAGSHVKSLPLHNLQALVSLLRWYSAVIPMAMGELGGLIALLVTALRARQRAQWVRLDGASLKELEFWRWLLEVGLHHPHVWSAPFWFLASLWQDRVSHELFTDASTLVGGGYVLSNVSFGQFRWEEAEKRLFASSVSKLTDSNVLEFVVAVLAIISEREYLKGAVVVLRENNMSAVSWLNHLRLKHMWGQSWMRLLITVSLCFDIRIMCTHVPRVENSIADGLSRYYQAGNGRPAVPSVFAAAPYANLGVTREVLAALWRNRRKCQKSLYCGIRISCPVQSDHGLVIPVSRRVSSGRCHHSRWMD
jgi:hypothetical protein